MNSKSGRASRSRTDFNRSGGALGRGMRGHKSSVLSPVVETTPTLPRSRMGNRPASARRSAKVRADDKNWGSAPHSRRLCETPALLIRIRVGQSNSSRHGWFDRPSFRVPHEAWIAAPLCGDRPWPLPLEQTNGERQRSIRLKRDLSKATDRIWCRNPNACLP